jgi:predicted house-cleaning noncanonical NTP pyrophosphatase (MazG superfamily)
LTEKSYNKLIRDRIPLIIQEEGKKPIIEEIISDTKFDEYLGKKLIEESKEYFESKQTEELVDILEIIYSLLTLKGITPSELEKKRLVKKKERGGFDKRLLLLKVIEEG